MSHWEPWRNESVMFLCRVICGWLIWFCVWFEVGSGNLITLTIARWEILMGGSCDPVSCQGRHCPVFNLYSSILMWMQYWRLLLMNAAILCSVIVGCFTWASASHFEQELVLWPLLGYLPPPTILDLLLHYLTPGDFIILFNCAIVCTKSFLQGWPFKIITPGFLFPHLLLIRWSCLVKHLAPGTK